MKKAKPKTSTQRSSAYRARRLEQGLSEARCVYLKDKSNVLLLRMVAEILNEQGMRVTPSDTLSKSMTKLLKKES